MQTLSFEGKGFEYFKIWIVNILLTIVTFGIYYPWAKVRTKRYFYANSTFDDKNFEYHATGKQLFLAYLIAIVLFVVFQGLSSFSDIASVVLVVLFLCSIPWVIWRSMKFNLNVTSFSNVRFKFEGKLSKSYLIFLAYPLLFMIGTIAIGALIFYVDNLFFRIIGVFVILILNIYTSAFLFEKNTSYLINHSKYGQGNFKSDLKVNEFIKIIVKTFLLGVVILSLFALLSFLLSYFFMNDFSSLINAFNSSDKRNIIKEIQNFIPLLFLGYILMLILFILTTSYYLTRNREYVFNNTVFDEEIKFSSSFKFMKFAYIIISNFLICILTLGLAIPWAKVRLARYTLSNTHIITNNDVSTYLSENEKKSSALGEQIGEAFDVDVGLVL